LLHRFVENAPSAGQGVLTIVADHALAMGPARTDIPSLWVLEKNVPLYENGLDWLQTHGVFQLDEVRRGKG
jgi:hypothetical protein